MTPSSANSDSLTIRYLSRADVDGAGVTIDAVIEAVETGFREKGNGRVEMPPKPGVHPGDGDNFIHAMPASIPACRRHQPASAQHRAPKPAPAGLTAGAVKG